MSTYLFVNHVLYFNDFSKRSVVDSITKKKNTFLVKLSLLKLN